MIMRLKTHPLLLGLVKPIRQGETVFRSRVAVVGDVIELGAQMSICHYTFGSAPLPSHSQGIMRLSTKAPRMSRHETAMIGRSIDALRAFHLSRRGLFTYY